MAKKRRKSQNTGTQKQTTNTVSIKQTSSKENGVSLPKLKFRIKRRAWVLLSISMLSIIGVIWGYSFINQSIPAKFTSKLTQVGDIELSYGEKQSDKISPLCGCFDVGEWENWRGITFTARNIEIDRKGDLPVTGYFIFSPYPQNTEFSPTSGFKIKTAYYLIEMSENERFNPQVLVSGKLPPNYRIVRRDEEADEDFVQIFSESKLNVSLFGDKPLGSWIGMEKSNISINYQSGQNATELPSAIIKEKYLKSTEKELDQVWTESGVYDQSQMAMPLGDFLGPNIVLWSDDEATSILASSGVIDIPKTNSVGKKLIRGMVVNPPFAVRIVTFAFGKDATAMSTATDPSEQKEKHYSFLGSQGRFDNGEVSIKINNPDKQAKDFEQIYQSIREKGTTDAYFKTYNSSELPEGKMEFKYPPIPPNNGFNIFGKINKLKITSTLGNLSIGSRPYNIEAPADFELRDIKEMEIKNGVMEIPLQIGMDEIQSKIVLRANSEIYVNNESITRRIDNNKTLIEYVVLIATIFGVIIAVVSTLIAIKDFAKAS
jgi:hypothetical protein